jgi:hypothetical protein
MSDPRYDPNAPLRSEGTSTGAIAGVIIAIVLIVGGIVWYASSNNTSVALNDRSGTPAITSQQTAPSGPATSPNAAPVPAPSAPATTPAR